MLTHHVNPYFCAKKSEQIVDGAVHLIGFGFDGTACFRKGARLGPTAIREVSEGIESYSPYIDKDLEDHSFYDCGDLCLDNSPNWQLATDNLLKLIPHQDLRRRNIKLLGLGGEHSVSYGFIRRYLESYDDLVLIHLDAHADLRDGYEGHHYSHASIIRRSLDHFKAGHELLQYGIRSGTKEEYAFMKEKRTLCRSRNEFFSRVDSIPASRPIYLTLDLDFFDPSYLPGTGTVEAGGEDFHCFVKLIKMLQVKNLVGADVVELAPEIDPTGNSNVFAAKVVRELLLTLV